jgi:c-di-GMP-binding flagellar brake protein YcgR
MINKRRYKRIPIAAVATVKYEGKDKIQSLRAITGNISYGGVGLYLDYPIEDGKYVSVNVNLTSAEEIMETVDIRGQVVHNKKIGDMYYCGIQFDEEVSDINHPLLYKYIESALVWDNP